MTGDRLSRTILFDLYGTLVPGGSRQQRDALSFQMAAILAVDPDAFAAIVRETFDARVRGTLGDLPATIGELAQRVGGSPSASQVARAAQCRLAFTRGLLENRHSASNLTVLKRRGHQLGVITDCSAETPLSWPASWLPDVVDAVSFSCELGVRKPDPEMHLAVTRRLDVPPEECLFIGDGGSNEMDGARALGMSAMRLLDPSLRDTERLEGESDWSGTIISSLAELVHDSAP